MSGNIYTSGDAQNLLVFGSVRLCKIACDELRKVCKGRSDV